MVRKKVAIVGSGCAGLGAAWALKDSKDYDIYIFESEPRLGGHTNTQMFKKNDLSLPVDTGFIVMNTATYPNFINFLKEVRIDTLPTEMTFAVSRDYGRFEWSGEGKGVFAQRRNLFRLRHWRMIFDIIRFNQFALDLLDKEQKDITVGEYLKRERYSQAFCDDYLIPMTAAVWSTSPDKASLEFPAQTLIRFMWNHHLVSTFATRPDWLTIPGGSQRYIDAIVNALGERLHVYTSSKVISLARPPVGSNGKVRLSWTGYLNGRSGQVNAPTYDTFDHVIVACHGDQVLPIIDSTLQSEAGGQKHDAYQDGFLNGDINDSKAKLSTSASQEEREVFNAFKTSENVCYLHSDLSLMPTRRDTWSSWNYLINSTPSKLSHPAGVSLTYNMNILQHISERTYGDVLVTMNPDFEPHPKLTQGRYIYRHPLYTLEAIRAQQRLKSIQNQRGVSYCGAWTKYGFHEDGFSSGLKVAIDHLGAKLPFEFQDSTYSRGQKPMLNTTDRLVRAMIWVVLAYIRIIDVVVGLPMVSSFVKLVEIVGSAILDLIEELGVLK